MKMIQEAVKKEVSSDDNDVTEVKAFMAHADKERVSVGKESARNGEWIKISMKKCINEQIPTQKKKILEIDQLTKDTSSSGPKDPVFVKSSGDNSNVSITGSNKPKLSEAEDFTLSNHDTATDYDSADESSVCSTPFPPLEKLNGAEPVSGPKTIKSILKIISLRIVIKPRNPQHVTKNCKTCGSNVHTTSDHNAIEWFRKREALQAKKNESFKASKTESSSALRSKTPTKRKPFTKSPNMYKEYLAEFLYPAKAVDNSKISFSTTTGGIYGEVGVNTFRKAVGAHYLSHSSEYVAPSSIDIVRPWFETIGYGEAFPSKRTRKNSLLPLRWRLLMAHIIQCLGDIIIKLNKKHREKVVPYTRFLSLLMLHKMKEGHRDGELTLYPTQVFSVNNWALKPDQTEEPPFTDHMLAICTADTPVVLKASKTSSKAERVSQGIKPGAKPGHKKLSTSSKQPSVSSKEAKKMRSSKAPTSSKTVHYKRRKESSSAMDSNPSEPPVSTPVDTGMHKEDQQVIGGPTYLEVTNEARSNPQLSSDMSAFNLNKPIFSASFIIHSECASENDASVVSTTEADLGKSAPSDFVP
nr:hypothetical protein [Tanacetum cinerariifolium]